MKYLTAYGIALVIFLAIDAIWLGLVARSLYISRIGDLILAQPRWGVAILFYAVFVMGLVYFAISAGMADGRWQTAAVNGALFGFFCYLTYDATNLSTLKGYDTLIAVVDCAWGTALSGVTAGGTVLVLRALGRA